MKEIMTINQIGEIKTIKIMMDMDLGEEAVTEGVGEEDEVKGVEEEQGEEVEGEITHQVEEEQLWLEDNQTQMLIKF